MTGICLCAGATDNRLGHTTARRRSGLRPARSIAAAKPLELRQPAEAPDPVLTMFPHPEGARWWISGQANIIFQGRLPFHSLYQGPNSFRNSAEYKTSLVGTLLHRDARPPAPSATTPT